MPSTPYDLVSDDLDTRVPLYADQAFDHGISFQAKLRADIWSEISLHERQRNAAISYKTSICTHSGKIAEGSRPEIELKR
ncbi:capon-like protein [Sergentomyia squamirostris]